MWSLPTLVIDERLRYRYRHLAANCHPRPDFLGGLLPQGKGPVAATLALDMGRRRRLEENRAKRPKNCRKTRQEEDSTHLAVR